MVFRAFQHKAETVQTWHCSRPVLNATNSASHCNAVLLPGDVAGVLGWEGRKAIASALWRDIGRRRIDTDEGGLSQNVDY